jgi:hypothetical protein
MIITFEVTLIEYGAPKTHSKWTKKVNLPFIPRVGEVVCFERTSEIVNNVVYDIQHEDAPIIVVGLKDKFLSPGLIELLNKEGWVENA